MGLITTVAVFGKTCVKLLTELTEYYIVGKQKS
jgi:hypothetical protein